MEDNEEFLLQAFSRAWQVGQGAEGEGCRTGAGNHSTAGHGLNTKDVIS